MCIRSASYGITQGRLRVWIVGGDIEFVNPGHIMVIDELINHRFPKVHSRVTMSKIYDYITGMANDLDKTLTLPTETGMNGRATLVHVLWLFLF